MKPTENYYVVEKVAKGGRSSFTLHEEIITVPIEVPRMTQTTEVIEVIHPPSSIPSPAYASGMLIGGTGDNRYMALDENPFPTVIPPQPLDTLDEFQ